MNTPLRFPKLLSFARRGVLVALAAAALAACAQVPPAKAPKWKDAPANALKNRMINSAAVSGDGSRVIAGTWFHDYAKTGDPALGDYGVYAYDGEGKKVWSDKLANFWQGVYTVDISRDGAVAVAGGTQTDDGAVRADGSKTDLGFVRAYQGSDGKRIPFLAGGANPTDAFATTGRATQIRLSRDGQWLVVGSENLTLFNLRNGVFVKTGEYTSETPVGGGPHTFYSVAISDDGQRIFCSDFNSIRDKAPKAPDTDNSYVRYLSGVADAKGVLPLRGFKAMHSNSVTLTPDGSVAVAGDGEGNVHYFTLANGGQPTDKLVPKTITIPDSPNEVKSVRDVAVDADGKAFVAAANVKPGSGILVRYLKDGTLVWSFPLAENPNFVSLNTPRGLVAVSTGYVTKGKPVGGKPTPDIPTLGHFHLVDVNSGKQIWRYETTIMNWPVKISDDANAVIGGGDDMFVYYFVP